MNQDPKYRQRRAGAATILAVGTLAAIGFGSGVFEGNKSHNAATSPTPVENVEIYPQETRQQVASHVREVTAENGDTVLTLINKVDPGLASAELGDPTDASAADSNITLREVEEYVDAETSKNGAIGPIEGHNYEIPIIHTIPATEIGKGPDMVVVPDFQVPQNSVSTDRGAVNLSSQG